MKIPARGRVPQRRRIFLGCEGESEQSYGALLGYLANEGELHIHIDNVLLRPGGGDPLALIEIAVRQIRLRSERRGPYSVKAALLDSDLIGRSPDRDERARGLARANGLDLLWQQPCHEGLLLRHLEGCHAMRPTTCNDAAAALKANWPEFYKAMPASRLRTRFDTASVLRAASVEHDPTELSEATRLPGGLRRRERRQPGRGVFFRSNTSGTGRRMMRPATLAEVAERLRAGEPTAKAFAEFLDDFYGARDRDAAQAKIVDEPASTGDPVCDALLAAVADYLCVQFTRRRPPRWTSDPGRVLAEPHFTTVSDAPEMKAWLIHSSPAEFKRHNIFTESRPLRRKMSERVPWATA